uniref:NADH-ubiquinone oxidoreductase chain 2 n=1 Tax=Pardachirus pavoninus TaxID=8286 RepID=X2L5W9_PARPV|nr:NADH dehydrogenase subunit 2 [Pardachirus pavoninus]AHN95318.1 NADH dehydrogenase subunit 2 [Pardachirus pavoninus]AID59825.1 NADH dehydrogenase subunit 2 [Pardachirus pavoninus]BAX09216.1 NADH dehydrogenase subunit 2 [Pardachirus pavoninus]
MGPYLTTIMLMSLGLGTTIVFSSHHWMLAWMGLEINTLAMIPLMAQKPHPRPVEAATKYFLTQAAAALVILFAAILNSWSTGQWFTSFMVQPLPLLILSLGLAMKIGLAPLHFWLPEVMQGLTLTTGLILATWQKLAPFVLLIQITPNDPKIMVMLGLLSILAGGWGGLNQTQLRKILAYSSIAHMGWMAIIVSFSPALATLTILVYFITTTPAFLLLNLTKTTNIGALATSWSKTPILTMITPLLMLSLAGLPPLSGFMPKLLIITELTKQQLGGLATLAAMFTLFTVYFYLRVAYSLSLTLSPNNLAGTTPWRFTTKQNTLPLATIATLSMMLLPLAPAMLTLTKP